ncbi:oligosaccharide flippase family protein [Nitrosovibrio sp. Nv6]|uniref:oligosaccharide flippase family protein n=1 Tax=Nitrosovibrio sp. Nv6 TaxID=1855340 RepID=UPI0008BB79D1|nr:oligosaccharide flippase family protein [Nitrosovibrio sp. Nv6]SEP35575.1 Membrane protein involved in the export of O-antigen and teichoic acid [Nitrosovibrio sp. Nv6]
MTNAHSHPFSGWQIRSSLGYFTVGKIASGLIGLVLLVVLVRLLPATEYGAYVIWVAIMEITLLVSNAGAYPIAQRYITEARLSPNLPWLPRLVWGSLTYRLLTLAIAAAALLIFAQNLLDAVGLTVFSELFLLYVFAIVFEGAARYIDLVFDALLQQGRSQFCILIRSGTRLAVVLSLLYMKGTLTLQDVIWMEVIAALFGFSISTLILFFYLRQVCAGLKITSNKGPFELKRIFVFSLPLYVAQCMSQLYSPDAVKMVISRFLGVLEAAAFGLAHAFGLVLQRYLPAQLLIGLIRPVLVARRAGGGSNDELVHIGNLILKVNHFFLIPVIAFFGIRGFEFVSEVSNGKHLAAGHLLFWLSGLLLLQGLHTILSAVAIALEDRRAVLAGTFAAAPGILAGIALSDNFGANGMVAGLWISELLWCSAAWWCLRNAKFHFRINWGSWLKLAACGGCAAWVANWSRALTDNSLLDLGLCAFILGLTYLVVCSLLKPFSAEERSSINRLLPWPMFFF